LWEYFFSKVEGKILVGGTQTGGKIVFKSTNRAIRDLRRCVDGSVVGPIGVQYRYHP
jgi:hypothetical protein